MARDSYNLKNLKTFIRQSILSVLNQKNYSLPTQGSPLQNRQVKYVPIIQDPLFLVKRTHGVLKAFFTSGVGPHRCDFYSYSFPINPPT